VSKEWVQWVIVGIIAVFSMLFGYVCVKFRKWGLALLAGWGGVMLGFAITTAFFVASSIAQYSIWIGLAIVCFLVTLYAEKKAIMILTSFIGSYCLIRGISLYAGGFPNEFDLPAQIKSGGIDFDSFPKAFYGYLVGIVVLWVLSGWFQFKHDVESKDYMHNGL
jgi:hypothetical protein